MIIGSLRAQLLSYQTSKMLGAESCFRYCYTNHSLHLVAEFYCRDLTEYGKAKNGPNHHSRLILASYTGCLSHRGYFTEDAYFCYSSFVTDFQKSQNCNSV